MGAIPIHSTALRLLWSYLLTSLTSLMDIVVLSEAAQVVLPVETFTLAKEMRKGKHSSSSFSETQLVFMSYLVPVYSDDKLS